MARRHERFPQEPEVRKLYVHAKTLATEQGRKVGLPDIAVALLATPIYGEHMTAARVTRDSIMLATDIPHPITPINEDEPHIPSSNIGTMFRAALLLSERRNDGVIRMRDVFITMFTVNVGGFDDFLRKSGDPRGTSESILNGRIDPDKKIRDNEAAYVSRINEERLQNIAQELESRERDSQQVAA